MPALPHLMECGHPSTQRDPVGKCRVCTGKFSGKFDGGKLRWDLIPVHAMEEVVKVYTHGAKKYAPDNFLDNPFEWRRALAAMKRHISEWEKLESVDPDSGCLHLAHAVWNALTLMEYERLGIGKDDRWRGPKRPSALDIMEINKAVNRAMNKPLQCVCKHPLHVASPDGSCAVVGCICTVKPC